MTNLRLVMEASLRKLLFLWVASLVLALGLLVFLDMPWLRIIFFPLAYMTLLRALWTTVHPQHDWMNPLVLTVLIGFVRFSIAGILAFFMQPPENSILQTMGLDSEDCTLGHVLALIGLLSLVIGWFLAEMTDSTVFQGIYKWLKTDLSGGIPDAALLGMLLGFIGLLVFVGSNMSIIDAISTGDFRSTAIQIGTGKYFYLSFMFIASSAVFSAYLVSEKRVWWITLLPVMVAGAAFWVLGGRARSFTPIAAGLLAVWSQKDTPRISLKTILGIVFIAMLLVIGFYAGGVYRQGTQAEEAATLSVSGLLDYIPWAAWDELGQLHALVAAAVIGPGGLGGRTFWVLLWPLSAILNLPQRSAGVFMAEELYGLSDWRWGFHATLIGDAYLNFGQAGVVIVTVIFGIILRILYVGFREGVISSAFYALFVVYSLRLFFESVEKYEETVVVFCCAFLVIKFGQVLSQISPTNSKPTPYSAKARY